MTSYAMESKEEISYAPDPQTFKSYQKNRKYWMSLPQELRNTIVAHYLRRRNASLQLPNQSLDLADYGDHYIPKGD